MSVTLVTENPASQMGVSMQLKGQEYWFTYLEKQVADAKIDEKTRADWEKKYDGYEMVWTFTNPKVPTGDGNIDAACIQGITSAAVDYANGGFCCGIKYIGGFSSQPNLWAIWFTSAQYKAFAAATGFKSSVDDTANWRSTATSYTVSWTVSRWLPKEERSADYYVNEYRFEAGDTVGAFTYKHVPDTKYAKGTYNYVQLKSAMSGIASGATALAISVGLLYF